MLRTAHLACGLGSVSFLTLHPLPLALGALIAVLPDFDRNISHRAWFSHSPFVAILLSLAVFYLFSSVIIAMALFIGFMSHILLDATTHAGVPLLFPFSKKRYGLKCIASDGNFANAFLIIVGLLMLSFNFWVPIQVY